jgi:CRISPR-associated protein Csy2
VSYQYLLLPRMRALSANAQPAWWVIGPPAMTAYAGFAHHMALAAGAQRHEGFAVVHHDIEFLGEEHRGRLMPHQFRAASYIDENDYASKNKYVLSSQPTARCHVRTSVVIRLADDELVDLIQVSGALRGARLAGGQIVEHEFLPRSDGPGACLLQGHQLEQFARNLRSGFSIVDRQDLMQPVSGERDPLDALLRATDPNRDDGIGWLCPTALGYREITERRLRPGSRGGLPHAFAEPLVGLVQFVPLRTEGLRYWAFTRPAPGVTVLTHVD